MNSTIPALLKLYLPGMLATVILVAALSSAVPTQPGHVSLQPFGGLITIDIPVHSQRLVIFAALGIALLCLIAYVFIDYSSLFPAHLKLKTFFDSEGLRQALEELRLRSSELRLAPRCEQLKAAYFQQVNADIERVVGVRGFFLSADATVYSHGKTSFIVCKVSGQQKYHVVEASGELLHSLQVPGKPSVQLLTLFEHMPSAADQIRIRFRDLISGRGVLLHPKFKQIMAEERTTQGVIFRYCIVGVTRIRIFPLPDISQTVYFADFGEDGLVPVAYGVYL